MEKLYTSKTFLKLPGGRLHTPYSIPLDPPLAISYRNHQKSLSHFSHLAPLFLFSFLFYCFFIVRNESAFIVRNTPLVSKFLQKLQTEEILVIWTSYMSAKIIVVNFNTTVRL